MSSLDNDAMTNKIDLLFRQTSAAELIFGLALFLAALFFMVLVTLILAPRKASKDANSSEEETDVFEVSAGPVREVLPRRIGIRS